MELCIVPTSPSRDKFKGGIKDFLHCQIYGSKDCIKIEAGLWTLLALVCLLERRNGETFSPTVFLRSDVSSFWFIKFDVWTSSLCALYAYSWHISAGECEGLSDEGQKNPLRMKTAMKLLLQDRLLLHLLWQNTSYFWGFLLSDLMLGCRICYSTPVFVFVHSRYPPAAANAVKSESGSGSGDSRQCGVCQIIGAASGAERWR